MTRAAVAPKIRRLDVAILARRRRVPEITSVEVVVAVMASARVAAAARRLREVRKADEVLSLARADRRASTPRRPPKNELDCPYCRDYIGRNERVADRHLDRCREKAKARVKRANAPPTRAPEEDEDE